MECLWTSLRAKCTSTVNIEFGYLDHVVSTVSCELNWLYHAYFSLNEKISLFDKRPHTHMQTSLEIGLALISLPSQKFAQIFRGLQYPKPPAPSLGPYACNSCSDKRNNREQSMLTSIFKEPLSLLVDMNVTAIVWNLCISHYNPSWLAHWIELPVTREWQFVYVFSPKFEDIQD